MRESPEAPGAGDEEIKKAARIGPAPFGLITCSPEFLKMLSDEIKELMVKLAAEREKVAAEYRRGWAEGQSQLLGCLDDDVRASLQGAIDIDTLYAVKEDAAGVPVPVICKKCGHRWKTDEGYKCPKCSV